tara:strand:+ start:17023 stop:17628 length:606 start_codon:yes stop_codon:yes gene_type:complete
MYIKTFLKSLYHNHFLPSLIFGLWHAKKYWKNNRQHVVEFPKNTSNKSIVNTFSSLKNENPLKHYYSTLIHDFIRFNRPRGVFVAGCSEGHEAYFIREAFPDLPIIGCDLDEEAIASCRNLNIDNSSFIVADITNADDLQSALGNDCSGYALICFETLNFCPPKDWIRSSKCASSLGSAASLLKRILTHLRLPRILICFQN